MPINRPWLGKNLNNFVFKSYTFEASVVMETFWFFFERFNLKDSCCFVCQCQMTLLQWMLSNFINHILWSSKTLPFFKCVLSKTWFVYPWNILSQNSTLQRPFKNLPPTGKAIPPPKISDSLYQSKAALMKQASITNSNPTNGTANNAAHQQQQKQQSQNAPPSSPPLPPPPEQTQNLPAPSDYAVTEL